MIFMYFTISVDTKPLCYYCNNMLCIMP